MKNIFALLLLSIFVSCSNKNNVPEENDLDQRAQAILEQMTLEEKVGQMTQLDISYAQKDGELIEERLDSIVRIYKIGSILGHGGNQINVQQWQQLTNRIQAIALDTRLKIPVIYGVDAIHGANFTQDAVLFPHNIGVAATRNADYGYQIARITSNDVLASGIRWVFDPVLDVTRNPLWPRVEETFGESVAMVSKFGESTIRGYEETNPGDHLRLASCMKHFLGYGSSLLGKDRTPAYIPDHFLHEFILPPFVEAIKAGSSTIMINSGAINGIPVHANKEILTDLLKDELGFEGFSVTDWLDIKYLYTSHHVATDNKDAVAMAINAGIDMSMVPLEMDFYYDLIDLVNEGKVPMSRIDDAVLRILKVKFKLGLFDRPFAKPEDAELFGDAKNKELALRVAQESLTLLKNESFKGQPVLPLNKSAKLFLTGPATNNLATLHGSWSFSWQGNEEELYPEETLTILEAFEKALKPGQVSSYTEPGFSKISADYITKATKGAKNADYILLFLGEDSYAEGAGNINDLTLDKDQMELAKAMYATGKPVVLVLTAGRPRIIADIEPQAQAILMAYRPGSQGGNAIVDVLFGDVNPSGRLPFSYPKQVNNFVNFDDPIRTERHYRPQWSFGFGLSYSSFEFGNIQLSAETLKPGESIEVTIDVKNTSLVDGSIAVDLFVKDKVASVTPAIRKHLDFNKIYLKAGESKAVKFVIKPEQLQLVTPQLQHVVEDGEFEVQIEGKRKKFFYVSK